ncbi:DnaD domain-containing protein [Rossellomorea vietnamensis]|uniref:DnaD domain-containing protein n=1 Tax=Rossellomorea vietnamensis TaxID=218284 RepID=UPI003CFAF3F7
MKVVNLKPGQFVFGRSRAASELNMKESTVWKYMKLLEKLDSISLNSNNKFTVVTVDKWGDYQSHEDDDEQQKNNKGTTKEQQKNTNKNLKNLKNSSSSGSSEDPFDFYHENLQVGVTTSPFVYQQIEHWMNDVTPEIVLAAMKLSAKKEKRGFDYTEGILKKWIEAGVKSLEDARKFEQSFKETRKAGFKKPIKKEDFDLSD